MKVPNSHRSRAYERRVRSPRGKRARSVKDAIANPWNHIDSSEFFSWENFFAKLLTAVTRGTYLEYRKSQLNQAYLQERELNAISHQLEPIGLPWT